MRKHFLMVSFVVILLGGSYIVGHRALRRHTATPTGHISNPTLHHPWPTITSVPTPANFNKQRYSLTIDSSLWVIVNKLRPLSPPGYVPPGLVVPAIPLRSNITGDEKYVRSDTAAALEAMATAAKQRGVTLNLQSGYRSYGFQVSLYNSYVRQQGQTQADQQSARAGYSEHQTGLAADLGGISNPGCNVAQCFADTAEGKWLAANAYRYGFIIRYPQGQQAVTGYEYEPWHVRYVGIALAAEMHDQNIPTLEAFFGLPAAPDYK
jgi:zinc D-Ala-D-Ala carboxypeptidase